MHPSQKLHEKPYEKLHSYAIWYIGKYAPSIARLRTKLALRCDDASLIDRVLAEVSAYIDEAYMIRSSAESLLSAGLWVTQIRSRLSRRGFDRERIAAILQETLMDLTSDTDDALPLRRRRIESLIADGVRKHESRMLLRSKLTQKYREASDEIDELLEGVDDRETLRSLQLTSDEPLTPRWYDRLARRGFGHSDIVAVFWRNIWQK